MEVKNPDLSKDIVPVYKVIGAEGEDILSIIVRIGSRNENASYAGIIHYIEHIILKLRVDGLTIDEWVNIFNINNELATNREMLSLTFKGERQALSRFSNIIYRAFKDVSFRTNDFESVKLDILNEIDFRAINKDKKIDDLIHKTIWTDPLGRNILGTKNTVKRLSASDVSSCLSTIVNNNDMFIITTQDEDIVWSFQSRSSDLKYIRPSQKNKFNPCSINIKTANNAVKEYCLLFPFKFLSKSKKSKLPFLSKVLSDPSGLLYNLLRKKYNLVYFLIAYPIVYEYESALIVRFVASSNNLEQVRKIILSSFSSNKDSLVPDYLLKKVSLKLKDEISEVVHSKKEITNLLKYTLFNSNQASFELYKDRMLNTTRDGLISLVSKLDLKNISIMEVE